MRSQTIPVIRLPVPSVAATPITDAMVREVPLGMLMPGDVVGFSAGYMATTIVLKSRQLNQLKTTERQERDE